MRTRWERSNSSQPKLLVQPALARAEAFSISPTSAPERSRNERLMDGESVGVSTIKQTSPPANRRRSLLPRHYVAEQCLHSMANRADHPCSIALREHRGWPHADSRRIASEL